MAQLRDVPIRFQGQIVPGVMGQIYTLNGSWKLTVHHVEERSPLIEEAIRNILGNIPNGQGIRSVVRISDGNILDYELYNLPPRGALAWNNNNNNGHINWQNEGEILENAVEAGGAANQGGPAGQGGAGAGAEENGNINMNIAENRNRNRNRNRNYRGGKRKQKSRKPSKKKTKKTKKTKRTRRC